MRVFYRAYAGPDQAKDRICRHGLQHLQMFGGRQIHLMSMTSSSVHYEIGCVPFIAAPRANAGIIRFTADGQHGREVCRSFSGHSISIACERPAVAQDAQVMKALSRALERSHKGQIFHWRLRFALRVGAKFLGLATNYGRYGFGITPLETSHVLAYEQAGSTLKTD